MKRLTHDLSAASENPTTKEQLDTLFDAMWPTLERSIAEAEKHTGTPQPPEADRPPQRTVEDMLGELVDRVRRLERDSPSGASVRRDEALATLRALFESGRLDPFQQDAVYQQI